MGRPVPLDIFEQHLGVSHQSDDWAALPRDLQPGVGKETSRREYSLRGSGIGKRLKKH